MTTPLLRLPAIRRSGAEPLHADGRPVGGTLLDFWQWSASDLVSNATRGRLAEYLVHRAVGSPEQSARDEWDAFDITTPDGIHVEVKSAAYVQSWHQERLSSIVFRTPKTRAWSADTNRQEAEARRQAQGYVFALLHHTDKPSVDPLNVRQWTFYVLPTRVLDVRTRSPGLDHAHVAAGAVRAGNALRGALASDRAGRARRLTWRCSGRSGPCIIGSSGSAWAAMPLNFGVRLPRSR